MAPVELIVNPDCPSPHHPHRSSVLGLLERDRYRDRYRTGTGAGTGAGIFRLVRYFGAHATERLRRQGAVGRANAHR